MKNKYPSKENIIFKIIRIALGLVFIFSAFVKGVDPLGTAYRVEDYLLVYNLEWMVSYKLIISFLLITVEFVMGFGLLFKLRYKRIVWLTFFMMIFFTVVTWFDAKNNLVPDCGCFGDAIKLTNWQTFYKNIVLLAMTLILLFQKKPDKQRVPKSIQLIILALGAIAFYSFEAYNYHHLPVIDFRGWKVGNDMKYKNVDSEKIYLTYKNKKTGELKEYVSPDYPWQDSAWRADWEFVGKRIDDSKVIKPHNLIIEDEYGTDITKELIENPEYQVLIISSNLQEANGEGMIKASELAHILQKEGINVNLITGSDLESIKTLKTLYAIDYPVDFADETDLKAMIRSNPGIILLHNGTIVKKWHFNDIPSGNELIKELANAKLKL